MKHLKFSIVNCQLSILLAALLLVACQADDPAAPATGDTELACSASLSRSLSEDATITMTLGEDATEYQYTLSATDGSMTPIGSSPVIAVGTKTINVSAWATVTWGTEAIAMPVAHNNPATPIVWTTGRPTIALTLSPTTALIRLSVTDSDNQSISTAGATMPAATPAPNATSTTFAANGLLQIAASAVKKDEVLFTIPVTDTNTKNLVAKKDYNFLAGVEYTFRVTITTKGEAVLEGFSIEGMEEGEQLGVEVMTIATIADLRKFRNRVNDGEVNLCAIQTADIVMEDEDKAGQGWVPIGKAYVNDRYNGTYNGGGYTITGLMINREADDFQGFFGYTNSGSKLTDIRLEEVDVKGNFNVGGLVGQNFGTIIKCSVKGCVTGNYQTGGLVGENFHSITECYTEVSVEGDNNTGGLVGENFHSITECYTEVSVEGDNNTGGLVGENDTGSIIACYATGYVDGYSTVGGLVGTNNSSIIACYATVSVNGYSTVGGLVGINNKGSISYCHAPYRIIGDSSNIDPTNSTTPDEAGNTVRAGDTANGTSYWKTDGNTPELYWQ
ncbi:GLUG motif-containing protein [Bacteroides sp. 519]|uniref:GLUG motif-containing protein n=1 Tax=Bacteroides sp. 519 TaxID=2302937 RepID=UPI0013D6769D|nr:GLUG motif-containing protein [Bacteroides sp. 519]NDV60612.1 hypothetical protein [Bacteroides sp. 519]